MNNFIEKLIFKKDQSPQSLQLSEADRKIVDNNEGLWIKILSEAEKIKIMPEDWDAEGNLLVSPDGPKSNLDEENWRIVRTESFKNWFGDWQLNSQALQDTSKIIDVNGEPLLVYHETNKDFEHFDDAKIGSVNDDGYYGSGHYFASNNGIPGFYSGEKQIIMKSFLNIREPYYFSDENPETLFYKYLLNRKPKEEAIAKATEYINIKSYQEELQELELGKINKHRDIPRGVNFDEYWEEKRRQLIIQYKQIISKYEKVIADLPKIYDELNKKYNGVIVNSHNLALQNERYTEIIAFQSDQIMTISKEYNN